MTEKLIFEGDLAGSQRTIVKKSDGLFLAVRDERTFLCSSIRVSCRAVDEKGHHYLVLKFRDVGGARQTHIVPAAELLSPKQLLERMVTHGLRLGVVGNAAQLLAGLLAAQRDGCERVAKLVMSEGWHGDTFVLGSKAFGPEAEVLKLWDGRKRISKQGAKGSLKDWNNRVTRYAKYSRALAFAIGAALAAPCLYLLGKGNFLILFFGPSAVGKSTLLAAASSVWEFADREQLLSLSATEKGLEEIAQAHNDQLAVLDEAANAGKHGALSEFLRMVTWLLAAGVGKKRSHVFEDTAHWRCVFMCSSEYSAGNLASSHGAPRIAGEQVRLLDVPATSPGSKGIFDRLPTDEEDTAKLANSIAAACKESFGVAGEQFVERLSADLDESKHLLTKYMEKFIASAGVPETGFERRFGERFAIIYAALRLARHHEIINLNRDYIFSAVSSCYKSSLAARGLSAGVTEALRAILGIVSAEGTFALLKEASSIEEDKRRSLSGYLDEVDGEKCFLIKRDIFESDICANASPSQVSHHLKAEELISFRARRTSNYREKRVDGKKEPFLCLRSSRLPRLRQLVAGEAESARSL